MEVLPLLVNNTTTFQTTSKVSKGLGLFMHTVHSCFLYPIRRQRTEGEVVMMMLFVRVAVSPPPRTPSPVSVTWTRISPDVELSATEIRSDRKSQRDGSSMANLLGVASSSSR